MNKITRLWTHPVTQIVAVLALWKAIDFLTAILVGVICSKASDPSRWTAPFEDAVTEFIGAVCAIATVILLQRLTGAIDLGRIGWTKRGVGMETLLGSLVGMAEYLVFMLCLVWANLFVVGRINSHFPFAVVMLYALSISLGEEVVFRGYILQKLETCYGTGLALFVSSAVFGAYHVGGETYGSHYLQAMTAGLPSGLLYASAYFVNRRLWLPVGIHFAWDFLAVIFWGWGSGDSFLKPFLIDPHINFHEPPKSLWLGGGLGLVESPISIGLDLVLSALLLVIAVRRGQWQKRPPLPLFGR